jgi:hypothetical protein
MTDPSPHPLPKHLFHATQREADALVAETVDDERFRPLPDLPPANNAVRMLVGMWYASGTLALPRGWVRAVMVACRAANAPHPNQKCLRWYRSKVQDCPAYFGGMRGVPRDLLLQIETDVDAG